MSNLNKVIKQLDQRGAVGADLSPGDELCSIAAYFLKGLSTAKPINDWVIRDLLRRYDNREISSHGVIEELRATINAATQEEAAGCAGTPERSPVVAAPIHLTTTEQSVLKHALESSVTVVSAPDERGVVGKLKDFIERAEKRNSHAALSKDISLAEAKQIVAALSARDEALEEAAEICKQRADYWAKCANPETMRARVGECEYLEKAIRALHSREQNAAPQDGHPERSHGKEGMTTPAGAAPDRSPASGEDGMPEDEFTLVHNTLNMVDMLLVEAGFKSDASVRHNLAIAKSQLRQVELNAIRRPAPSAGMVMVPRERLEYIRKLPRSYPVSAIVSMVEDMLAASPEAGGRG